MISSLNTLYSIGWTYFHQKNLIKWKPIWNKCVLFSIQQEWIYCILNLRIRPSGNISPSYQSTAKVKPFPFSKLLTLSLFICLFLNREVNMTHSVYTLYSISWVDFHDSIWILWKPTHIYLSRSTWVKRDKHLQPVHFRSNI